MRQQKQSTFVNVLSWIFIVVAGFMALISVLQNIMITVMFPVEEMNQAFNDPQIQEDVPAVFRFMFSNIRLFFLSFLILSGAAFISAIGLLKRKNWARIIFIGLMGLGIFWNVFSLIVHNAMFTAMPEFPPDAIDTGFSTMMTVMKVFMFIMAIGLSYLCGWIIYKLTSADIKAEFVDALPLNADDDADAPEMLTGKKKRRNIMACAVALTIALGVYYFSTGNIKTGKHGVSIQQLARTGDAERLTALLKEQPDSANNAQNGDWPPLHAAACNGQTECVRLLIEAGADVNAQSCNQRTALHCGAEDGNIDIVALLLKAGADPGLKDSQGKTPLDWAVWNNHQDVADLLKKHNAGTDTEEPEPVEE